MAMKVCFVTPYCSHYFLPVLEALSERHDMFFAFTEDGSARGWSNFGTIRYALTFSMYSQLITLLKGDFDILICEYPTRNSFLEFAAKVLRRKNLIYDVEEWYEPRTLTRKLLAPILKFIARRSDAIVVCGSAAKAHMLSYGVSQEKIFTGPEASWVEVPSAPLLEQRIEHQNGKFVILYMGRLIILKGVDILIRAFSRLQNSFSNVELLIVGDGELRSSLTQLTEELRSRNVRFLGECSLSARADYYSTCDVVVLPSIWTPQHCEAWGLTLNEAMQFGKPVIATDAVGAAFDVITDGVNGFVVKNGDVESLYRALKKLVDDPALQKRMGQRSLEAVRECFTYQQRADGYVRAIAHVENSYKKKAEQLPNVERLNA